MIVIVLSVIALAAILAILIGTNSTTAPVASNPIVSAPLMSAPVTVTTTNQTVLTQVKQQLTSPAFFNYKTNQSIANAKLSFSFDSTMGDVSYSYRTLGIGPGHEFSFSNSIIKLQLQPILDGEPYANVIENRTLTDAKGNVFNLFVLADALVADYIWDSTILEVYARGITVADRAILTQQIEQIVATINLEID